MNLIEPYLVKISTPNGVGSGFVIFPDHEVDQLYIVTARHIIFDDEALPMTRPTIEVLFTGTVEPYRVAETDVIIAGENNDTEDLVLIILPLAVFAGSGKPDPGLQLMVIPESTVMVCQTSGYPKLTQNSSTRTLNACKILNDKDYPDEIQLEVDDPLAKQHNADDLIEGFSGSPLYIVHERTSFIAGIFLGYEAASLRILAINAEFINTLLARAEREPVVLKQVELDISILDDIQKINVNNTRILNRIQDHIGEMHIDRPTLEDELQRVIRKQSLTVVYGKPGIGKSAITKKVLSGMTDHSLIGLQGEQLDKTSIREVFQSPAIGVTNDPERLFASPALTPNKIIFIDSIEKVLETVNAETIIDFFNLIKSRNDLRIVLTCRSYAIEQLKIRFLQQYKNFHDFEIPVLSDDEMIAITGRYPFIRSLLANASLKRILQIPFNIDKATIVQSDALNNSVNNELDFKQVMWDYVIEGKEHEPDPLRRKLRGEIFSAIAYERAQAMAPYIELANSDMLIISALQKDQLIETDLILQNRYAPAHDIYEDWALTRKIEGDFQNYLIKPMVIDFFEAIGSAPAIRRAFRIWISEKIQVIDFNIQDLILNCLGENTLATYWKDEILIAIMQSPYSKDFLEANRSFLFENDLHLFKRCALLLRVACQTPDLGYLRFLNDDQKNYVYMSSYLKPIGEGWPNMITFMFTYIAELRSAYKLVLQIVFQWEKSLGFDIPPPEARLAALILHNYFQEHVNREKADELPSIDRDEIKTGIQLLLRLAKLIPEEISEMLTRSIADENSGRRGRSDFWHQFKVAVLDWEQGYPVCELFPEQVIAVAEKEWFYYPPTEEELREYFRDSPLGYFPRTIDTDEKFGVTDDRDYKYSPSSAYQTPIWHLIRHAPVPTLAFVIRLFNHSVDAFFRSDFLQGGAFWPDDERNEFTIELVDGVTNQVQGSQLLWAMYRGLYNITSPKLLQSVLMAFEKWLLDAAKIVAEDTESKLPVKRKNFEFVFNEVLKESQSVSLLAVLISVATAYPELCKKLVQPLLKIRLFYKWDLIRCSHEGGHRFMTYDDPKLIKIERKESDSMPHHREDMEMLIRKLTFSSERSAIFKILDDFYAEDPTEVNWKLALNRMDIRKAEIVERTEEGYVMMPKIDEELQPVVAEAEREQEAILPIRIATNWALQKWDEKPLEDESYQAWQGHYEYVLKADTAKKDIRLFNQPGTLAAVGIRFYFDELTAEEKAWCTTQVFRIIEAEIKRSHDHFSIENDGTYGSLDPDHVFQVLVTLIDKCDGEQQAWAKELLIASLIFIHNKLSREELNKSVKSQLWQVAPDFALNCVAGLLEYAKVSQLRARADHFHPGFRFENQPSKERSKWAMTLLKLKKKILRIPFINAFVTNRQRKADELILKQWQDQYNHAVESIIDRVVREQLTIDYTNNSGVNYSPHYLIEILDIIPSGDHRPELEGYYTFVIEYLLSQITRRDLNRMEEIDYSLQQDFAVSFAGYLLLYPGKDVLPMFKKLTDWLLVKGEKPIIYKYNDKRLELVIKVMKEMLRKTYDRDTAPDSFWEVWNYVFETFAGQVNFFNGALLLNPDYGSQTNWQGLKGKKSFYKRVIPQLQDVDETIRLITGPGFTELLPEAIEWFADLLKDKVLKDSNTIYLSEKMTINVYYDTPLRNMVKNNKRLKDSFILILDKLIDQSSAAAFLIREDFISIK